MPRSSRDFDQLTASQRHRRQAVLLARAAVTGALLFVAYFLLPLNEPEDVGIVVLVGGLILIAGVMAWHVREIVVSPYPRLRGFQALITGIPLLLVVFAAVYYITGHSQVGSFTEPMDKIGAMYFTVTVFSTVGFGDITAKTDLARTLVTFQMLFNLVVIGLVAKVIFGAVDVGVKKRSAEHHTSTEAQEPTEPATG